MSSSSELPGGCWSAAAERTGRQGRRTILQALARSVDSGALVTDERAGGGGGVRAGAGAGAVLPPRHGSSEPAAAAASRPRPASSGTGGAGSPADADDGALLLAAAAAPSPPGLTAEMALSILVDCFGH